MPSRGGARRRGSERRVKAGVGVGVGLDEGTMGWNRNQNRTGTMAIVRTTGSVPGAMHALGAVAGAEGGLECGELEETDERQMDVPDPDPAPAPAPWTRASSALVSRSLGGRTSIGAALDDASRVLGRSIEARMASAVSGLGRAPDEDGRGGIGIGIRDDLDGYGLG